MGLFASAFERKGVDPLQVWEEIARAGRSSKAGPRITFDAALRVSVAFACMQSIARGWAQVPFKLFREQAGRIEPATDHPLYDMLAVEPSPGVTSYEFRETLAMHALLGNGYVFKNRVFTGRLMDLPILRPDRTKRVERDGKVAFEVSGDSGAVRVYPAETIWHVRGPTWDNALGLDTLNLAREALGLAIATEESHASLHAKGVRTSGTYSVEGSLNPDQYAQLKAWIIKENAGAENAAGPMILDRGAKWLSTAMTGIDSQHLETRKFQIEEVCRFFNVMPIMVGYSDKTATYASAEQMFLAHVVHTLMPWFARFEQSANINLLTPAERKSGLYFKSVAAGLMRGASKDRADYFKLALGGAGNQAWMSADEVRALEEMNPMGGDAAMLPSRTPPQSPTQGNQDGA